VSYFYEFDAFQMDPGERVLSRGGMKVPLTPRAFDVLLVLVQRSGHLVAKRELIEAVWHDSFVEEANVCVTISMLRKALGAGEHSGHIETVPKRGYRFNATVTVKVREDASFELVPSAPVPAPPQVQSIATEPLADSAERPPFPLSPSQPRSGHARWPVRSWLNARASLSSLRWLITILFLAAIGSVLLARIQEAKRLSASATEVNPIRSIAVLPFTNDEGGEDAYLDIGMSDALTSRLSHLDGLRVRSSSAMTKYASAPHDPYRAGTEQGVEGVVDGRIRRIGDRVRVTVRLIRVADQAQIWNQTFDEKYTGIFDLQESISEQVAQSIRVELTPEERKQLAQHSTQSNSAYESYMKGRFFMDKRTREGLTKGLKYYQEAVKIDPAYAEAYAGMADTYALLGLYTELPPKEAFPEAKKAALKALEIDRSLGDAYTTLGFVSFYYEWDGAAADREFSKALARNPSDAIAHSWRAENLAAMGRFAEAVQEAGLAMQADPLSPVISTNAGYVLYLAGANDEALKAYKNAIEIDPDFARAHYRLAYTYLRSGSTGLAMKEFHQAVQLSGDNPYYEAGAGQAYAELGKMPEARQILHHLIQNSTRQYVPPYAIAQVYAGLGDRSKAFEWLSRAYDDKSTSIAYLKVDPSLSSLRSDPRFAVLSGGLLF
jgi:DNA-binding winged helix-turn-helix (wHTH) protein/TolB-like protein/Flp pilus assembly protein TadD